MRKNPFPVLAIALAAILLTAPAPVLAACGDGVLDPAEDCDDGNVAAGDCCAADCLWEDNGSPCAAPDVCFTAGACDDGECIGTTPTPCDDGNPCTTDSCDAEAGGCLAAAIDGCCTTDGECSDGIVCNGVETCVLTPFAPTGACAAGASIGCNDGDPCTRDSCSTTARGCVFAPDENGLGCVADDADSDGVWDRLDECPDTPLGIPVSDDGCATGDLAENPRRLIDESDKALEKLTLTMLSPEELARERKLATKARRAMEAAMYAYRGARSCKAAKSFFKAEKSIETLLVSLDQRRRAAYAKPPVPVAPIPAGTPGDNTEADMLAVLFETISQQVQRASTRLVRSSQLASDTCRDAVPEKSEGTVASADAARGRFVLTDGRVVRTAGASLAGTPLVGATLAFVGERTGTADIVARTVLSSTRPKLITTGYDPTLCYDIRVAPIQPEPPVGVEPLHYPLAGYRGQGEPATSTHWLERKQSLFVQQRCTPPNTVPDASGNYTRYYVDFRVTTKAAFSNKVNNAASYSVNPGQWWALPDSLSGPGTLTATWHSMACKTGASPECPSSSIKQVKQLTYKVNVNKTGGYCRAEYESTVFSLEDRDPDMDDGSLLFDHLMDDFAEARVIGTSGLVTALGGTRSFVGQGYKVLGTGGPTSFPLMYEIVENQAFAIFAARDPIWNETSYYTSYLGVETASGLAWPSVDGIRNGVGYRYACTVPDIVRDRIDECTGDPDSFYRLPYRYESGDVECGQGNNSNFTHCGEGYPYECGQKYAFDFSVPDGQTVLAARGGVVLSSFAGAQNSCSDKVACDEEDFFCCVESSGGGICTDGDPMTLGDVCNADSECDSSPGSGDGACRCVANWVAIEHADGSVGVYVHMQKNKVDVKAGDRVFRGDHLGKTGTTGCSTGPHVHFHVVGTAGKGTAWEKATQPVNFQKAAGGKCVVPTTNSKHRSNNGEWFGF